MTIIRVSEFGGMIPKLDDKTLPQNCAVDAINCNFTSRGIAPTYAIQEKIANIGAATTAQAASLFGFKVTQIPSSVVEVVGGGGATFYARTETVPPAAAGINYVVAATDDLWYAVFLPSGTPAVSGVGCIDIEFSDAFTLGVASVVDQNALSAVQADITGFANGKWYVRKIQLGGKLRTDGSAITGATIKYLRLNQNHSNAALLPAYYAFAIIRDRNAPYEHKKYLIGPESAAEAFVLTTAGSGRSASWKVIDEDEVLTQNYPVLITSWPGIPRNKMFASLDQSMVSGYQRNVASLTSHDAICSAGASASGIHFTFEDAGNIGVDGHKTIGHSGDYRSNVYGWVGVQAPPAAPTPVVVGGTGPSITRAYVYTRVTEDGLESGPSPAGSATGNRDGTWTITPGGAWTGTDTFRISTPAGSLLHKRRIYRTPEGESTYQYVGELDDNDVSLVDAVLDANLGEDLPTSAYKEMPPLTALSPYLNGMIAGVLDATQVCFSDPYQFHAWPLINRYTVPMVVGTLVNAGDRLIALGNGKPIAFSGQSPDSLQWTEYYNGEACLSQKAVAPMRSGAIYAGATAWAMIDSGGVQSISDGYFTPEYYASVVSASTIAMFDGRRLVWFPRGSTFGFALELGAQERALSRVHLPYAVYGMGYYEPRNSRWLSYWDGSATMRIGKLWGDTNQRLKWTWTSKLLRTSRPVNFMVAQIESDEWASLSPSMQAREAALVTVPPGVPYSISITGLTQAEKWLYLKVWAEADHVTNKVLVYDDFVVSDRPVVLAGGILSDCFQFELRGNIEVMSIALAETERELNEE